MNFDSSTTTKGFTGHEMLDEVGLIHMNGRIYDPRLGRFMQADPFIQLATDGQMYNRYSYARNNPLVHTDPSGFILPALVGLALTIGGVDALIVAVVVGLTAFGQTLAMGGDFGDAFKAGLLAGVSSFAFSQIGDYFGGLAGGNQAFANNAYQTLYGMDPTSAFIAASKVGLTTAQTVGRIASHASLGGVMSVVQGGKFGHGFLSAGVNAGVAPAISSIGKGNDITFSKGVQRATAAAIVGGTVSKVTGGNFANGASTAAFAQTFNDLAHEMKNGQLNRISGKITERMERKAFDNKGQAITKRGQYGPDTKIEAPLEINILKKSIGKSLNLDIEITMRKTGEFQRYDVYSREVKFTNTYTNSILTGDIDRYYVGPWESTSESIWRPTDINVRRYPVKLEICPISCGG